MDCFGTYCTHAQSCDSVRVQSGTERTASVHTLHGPKAVITFVFKVLLGTCSIFAFSLFRVSAFSRFRAFTCSIHGVFAFSCFPVFAFACFCVFVLSHVRFWRFRVFGFSRFAGGIRVAETQISYAQTVHEATYVWFVPAILHHDGWGHGGPCLKFTSKIPTHTPKKRKHNFWWKHIPYMHIIPQFKILECYNLTSLGLYSEQPFTSFTFLGGPGDFSRPRGSFQIPIHQPPPPFAPV